MLRLLEFITADSIRLGISARDKESLIRQLTTLLFEGRPGLRLAISEEEAFRLLLAREKLAATGIGNGVAIPHAGSERIKTLIGGFARSPEGIDFGSMDGIPCTHFFVLLSPTSQPKIHIKALSRISRVLAIEEVRTALMEATTAGQLFEALRDGDRLVDEQHSTRTR